MLLEFAHTGNTCRHVAADNRRNRFATPFEGHVVQFDACRSIQAFGGKVIRAGRIMHGKTSPIRHAGQGVFAGIPDSFEATRYHSLVVERDSLPDCLEMTAWTENADGSIEEIMGLRHREHPIQGVQFHPESILTQHGHAMLKNFLSS